MAKTSEALAVASLALLIHSACCHAQSTPPSPSKVWHSKAEESLQHQLSVQPTAGYPIDPNKKYTLAELIDLAEQHNPDTRVAWEAAKSKADALGIARSALYPTMAVVALGLTDRTAVLIDQYFHRQTEGIFEPTLHVEYLIFDVGGRSGAIDVAKANLLAANLAFNDTHRKIIFAVASAYYRLLNAEGQREAAEVSLKNAQTVEEDAQSRLDSGPGAIRLRPPSRDRSR
jgi:outer membrane protein